MWFKIKLGMMSERDCILTHERFETENGILWINASKEDERYPVKDAVIRME